MKIGIIGNGTDKFTEAGRRRAVAEIHNIFNDSEGLDDGITLVSGHSPVGGIDIWAEDVARELGYTLDLKIPRQHTWDAAYGYKQRNLDIARDSDELHVILVDTYPKEYRGAKFKICYHCYTDKHIKSGACWTAKQAQALGKNVFWHIIKQET
jgi:hypothetical protein